MSKQLQWERKLLDLSLRNNLLNLRNTKNIIPLLISDLSSLENELYNSREYPIKSSMNSVEKNYPEDLNFHNLHILGEYANLMSDEKNLYSPLSDILLKSSLTSIYRASKSAVEETGSNTLFLAFGLLQWYEKPGDEKPRYAPLILVPMEIVRQSALIGYKIRQRDEDAMINTTLLEFLKQDYGIVIENLDPLPTDDIGVDVEKVFQIISDAISNRSGWAILKSSYLGIFSFSQFAMWKDIRSRSEQLSQNKIVKSLIDGKLSWQAESMNFEDNVNFDDVMLPVAADSSQLFAVKSSMQNKSFILHGPPGTGKSQTITAIISNAMAQGKTVLFVSEKMAALSVVENRMAKLGLGNFCLEVHSNKAKKKDVLSQLKTASETISNHNPQEYTQMLAKILETKKSLDSYSVALHKERHNGYSFYQMISNYEDYKKEQDIELTDEYVKITDKSNLTDHLLLIEELCAMAKSLVDLKNNPLRFVGIQSFDYNIKFSIEKTLADYKSALVSLNDSIQPLVEILNQNVPKDMPNLEDFIQLIKALGFWKKASSNQRNMDIATCDEIIQASNLYKNSEQIKEIILKNWDSRILTENAKNLQEEWSKIQNAGFFGKLFSNKKIISKLKQLYKGELDTNILNDTFVKLLEYQNQKAYIEKIVEKSSSYFGVFETIDWENEQTVAQNIKNSLRIFEKYPDYERYISKLDNNFDEKTVTVQFEDFSQKYSELSNLLAIKNIPTEDFLKSQFELCNALLSGSDYIRDWANLNSKIYQLENLGLESISKAIYVIDLEKIAKAYIKAYFKKSILQTLSVEPVLAGFSGVSFDEKIQQFKLLQEEFTNLTKNEIFYRIASRIPDFTKEASQSSELGILQKAIRSNGRGVSIRRLFSQIPSVLPRLCPCMLMSPLSAAQYLDVSQNLFDLVVFDEASQLTTAKAVGVLARGQNAIIVGDPKQMPPTAFFGAESVDEENIEQEDLESILDDCLALSMPQTHLLWHYRSGHESLISFSNQKFYESKLYTFPSFDDRKKMVKFVPSNGIFDRGNTRTNEIEAKLIVDEVLKRYTQNPDSKDSIGIVTFNISQQTLIEDLLEEEFSKNPDFDTWANNEKEPIFVKNLENVQGDERDIIMFSIAFGPDKDNKLYMNFGPLNKDGGWRRLNVAITRSRKEMLIFSSLEPSDIDLSKTQAEGVVSLKAFLEYAKTGNLPHTRNTPEIQVKGIAKSLEEFLNQNGYKVEHNIGHSKFKLDFAVIDPKDSSQYILGVMLDGETYKNAKTTSDRELSTINVLKNLNWNICRIWSMDYFANPQKEFDKLLSIIKKIENNEIPNDIMPEQKNLSSVDTGNEIFASNVNDTEPILANYETNKSDTPQNSGTDFVYSHESMQNKDFIEEKTETENPYLSNSLNDNFSSDNDSDTISIQEEDSKGKSVQKNINPYSSSSVNRNLQSKNDFSAGSLQQENTQKKSVQKNINPYSAGYRKETPPVEQSIDDSNNIFGKENSSIGLKKDFIPEQDYALNNSTKEIQMQDPSTLVRLEYNIADLKEYEQNSETFSELKNIPKILNYISEIVNVEAPITQEFLKKRIMQLFGITRISRSVDNTITNCIRMSNLKYTNDNGELVFWNNTQNHDTYNLIRENNKEIKRDIEQIPGIEISNAILLILFEQVALPKEELIKESAKIFGFSRTSEKIAEIMSRRIEMLIEDNKIDSSSKMLKLK